MKNTKKNLIFIFCCLFIFFPLSTYAIEFTHKAHISGMGSPNYLNEIRKVEVSGNYAYAAGNSDNSLVAFDISDVANGNITKKAHITGIGSPNYLQNATNLAVSGDYVYVTGTDDDTLVVFDISDVANGNITKKAHITGAGSPNYLNSPIGVFVSGDYAFVTSYSDHALSVFDISDVANGNITKKAHISGTHSPNYLAWPSDVFVEGDYAYVTSRDDDALVVFDISDVANGNITKKAHITGAGSPNYLNGAYDVSVVGDYAYVSTIFDNSLVAFDISDVANGNITKKAHIAGAGSPNYLGLSAGIVVAGDYAYVASASDNSLGAFDISDVANGNITLEDNIQGDGSPNYLDWAYGLARSGNYIFVAALDDDTLSVFEFPADTNTAPIVGHTSNNVLGTVTQDTDGTGNVNILFRVQDADTDGCTTLEWQYSDDGGATWNDLVAGDMTGEDGSKSSATDWTGTEHTIVWNSQNQIDNTDQDDIQFAFRVNDGTVDSSARATSTSFTVDNLDPSVSVYFPTDNLTGVTTTANLVLTFDEAVDVETGNITIYDSTNTVFEAIPVTASTNISGSGTATIEINPTSTLSYETSYYIQIDATAFDDTSGNSYAGISDTTTWSFTTEDTPICPTVENAATYNAYPTCGVATCDDGYNLVDGVCVKIGGAAPPPPPSIGAGTSEATIGMYETGNISTVDTNGINVLMYIWAKANFKVQLSGQNNTTNHSAYIKNLDLHTKKIKILFQSEPVEIELDLGETKLVDLNNDGINDIKATFSDLIVNRVELTLIDLHKEVEAVVEEEKETLEIIKPSNSIYNFTRNLYLGLKGEDVRQLQKYLNNNGFNLAETSYGSPGNETTYFGPLTKTALSAFQKANNIFPTAGYFGIITRGFISK